MIAVRRGGDHSRKKTAIDNGLAEENASLKERLDAQSARLDRIEALLAASAET